MGLEWLITAGAQRAFVADASHQLRSPLAALRLEIEDLPVRPEGAEGQQRVLDELRRLNRLVDGLLMLARAEAPTRDTEPVDVAALVRERAETWRPLAEEFDIQIVLAAPRQVVASRSPTTSTRSSSTCWPTRWTSRPTGQRSIWR